VSKKSVRSLAATIAAQEELVQEADRRLAARLAAAFSRVRGGPRAPLSSIGLGSGVLAAAWFLLRQRRSVVARTRLGQGGRLSVLLNSVLPLLTPAIGMRAVGILTALASVPAPSSHRRAMAAPHVDLERYSGTWYEIGRMLNKHERHCAGDVTATYLPDDSGMRVINCCRRIDGRFAVARGRARVVDRIAQSKLQVTFAPALVRWLPMAWADYWILDVAPDYGCALVGTPDRRSLWILARAPSLPATEYHALLMRAEALGYDTRRVHITPHSGMPRLQI
jgi:apolipoprotein D and lipocalin family protein